MTHIQDGPDPRGQQGSRPDDQQGQSFDGHFEMKIPVIQEELHVGTRTVDTGRGVRIHKTVSETEQIVDPPLMHEELSVERVEVGEWIDLARKPEARYEGDTYIVPVFEEVLVVEKRLRLKEELRITRHNRETRMPQSVVLRSENVLVERFDRADGVSGRADPDIISHKS